MFDRLVAAARSPEDPALHPIGLEGLCDAANAGSRYERVKALYERTFHTPDYFAYDPNDDALYGWRLRDRDYEPLEPDAAGRLWSAELDARLGRWEGDYLGQTATWLRLFDAEGQLLPTHGEAGHTRAAELAAEYARLLDELRRLKGGS